MAVTIAHVAEKAKVSKTTVSRILSKASGFKYSRDTCEKVLEAAKDLSYTPSSAAQLMRLKNIKMIGICTQTNNSIFSYSMLESISNAIKDFNYYPILIDLNESLRLFGTPHLHRLDYLCGIICLYTSQIQAVKGLCSKYNKDIPIVSLGANTEPEANINVVASDHISGVKLALKYLAELGHEHIEYVSSVSYDSKMKIRGFEEGIREYDLNGKVTILDDKTAKTYDLGTSIGQHLIANPAITAVLCPNDEVALGLISDLKKRGIKVPDDISVVGYDDLAFSKYTTPSLTTIRQDVSKISHTSAKVLMSIIQASPVHHEFIPEYTRIETQLIIRESTRKI